MNKIISFILNLHIARLSIKYEGSFNICLVMLDAKVVISDQNGHNTRGTPSPGVIIKSPGGMRWSGSYCFKWKNTTRNEVCEGAREPPVVGPNSRGWNVTAPLLAFMPRLRAGFVPPRPL